MKPSIIVSVRVGKRHLVPGQIWDRQEGYILPVKENQLALYQDIREYFEYGEERAGGEADGDCRTGGLEKDHGRIERGTVTTVTGVDRLEEKEEWKNLAALIRCQRTIKERTTITDRYYTSGIAAPA
jgi:hypothetical protein